MKAKERAVKSVPAARTIEYLPLEKLPPALRNPRRHAEKDLDASVGRFGYAEPVLLDERTGRLIAGHGRVEALERLKAKGKPPPDGIHERAGSWLVPVVRGWSSKNDREAEAYLVASNQVGAKGGWDHGPLAEMLKGLEDVGLEGVGFGPEDVLGLLELSFVPERVAISDLKPHPKNYREHPEDQLEHVIESIKLHGFYRNVVIARDGTVLAGHGVVQAARKMGRKTLPVVRLDLDPNEPRALKVLTSDNEISNLAAVDDRALTELLKGIMDTEGLLGTGFNQEQLAALTFNTRTSAEVQRINETGEWAGLPEYAEGATPIRLVVTFLSLEDLERFTKSISLRIDKKQGTTWSTRWPWTDRGDRAHLKFEAKDPPVAEPAS